MFLNKKKELVSLIELEFLERADKFKKSLGHKREAQLAHDARFDKEFFYLITNRFHFKDDLISFAVIHPQCPVDLLLEIVQGGELSADTLNYIASNRINRNPKIVDALLLSEHGSVLECLLKNQGLYQESFEAIYKLHAEPNPDYVNSLIFMHGNCPREIRLKLMDRCQGLVHAELKEMQVSQNVTSKAIEFKAIAIKWMQTNIHLFHTFDVRLLRVLLDMPGITSYELLLKCTQHPDSTVRLLARARMSYMGVVSKIQISFSDRIRDYLYNEFNLRIDWKTKLH